MVNYLSKRSNAEKKSASSLFLFFVLFKVVYDKVREGNSVDRLREKPEKNESQEVVEKEEELTWFALLRETNSTQEARAQEENLLGLRV